MQVKSRKPRTKGQNDGGKSVAAYLAALPKDSRAVLQRLRKDIRAAAPDATELIAWGMPAFKRGKLLVGYAAFEDHCSFFPMSAEVMRDNAAALKKFTTTKGSVHFTLAKPIPSTLVRKLVKARVAENEAGRPVRSRR